MDLFKNENTSSDSTYSLFGPSKVSTNQGLLMISPHVHDFQPLTDATNLIRPPVKSLPVPNCSTDRKKLFVGNLPSNTTLDELIELFSKYGRVNRNLSVVKDDNYAFIHFYSETDAEQAHKELNDSFFKNRYIRVQYSVSQGHMKKSRPFSKSQQLSASSSYTSICSNDNTNQKLCQSQSVMSFNNLNLGKDFNRQIGRPIKKTFQREFGSNYSNMPVSQSFDEIGLIASLNRVNYSNIMYIRNLLEQRTQLQQIEESKISPTNLINSFSNINLNQF